MVYCMYTPPEKRIPSSGMLTSRVTVALATVPTFISDVPVGDVVRKFKVPAVAELTINAPFKRLLPAKITSAASAAIPIDTFAAGWAEAAAAVIVLKNLVPA